MASARKKVDLVELRHCCVPQQWVPSRGIPKGVGHYRYRVGFESSRVVQHRNRTQVDIGRGKFLDQRGQGAGRSPAYPRLWYPRSPSCEGRPACCLPAPRRGGAARSSAGSRPASTTAAAPIRCAPRSTPPSFCPTRLFHFVPTASPRNSDLRAVTQLPINPFMLPSEPLTRGKT